MLELAVNNVRDIIDDYIAIITSVINNMLIKCIP